MKVVPVALLSLLATTAFARPPGPPPPPPDQVLADNADELGIDAATLAEATRIVEAARPELDALHQAMHERRKAVMDEVMQLLTPEQQESLRELLPPPPHHRPPPQR